MSIEEFPDISSPRYVRAQCVMQGASQLPEDEVVNTWHFVVEAGMTIYATLTDALDAFYTQVGPYLSNDVSRVGAQVKFYDLSVYKPNPPFLVEPLVVAARTGSNVDLPREVSLALSYQAPVRSGYPQARRRGRLYIGPLATGGSPTDLDRPTSPMINAIQDAARIFRNASNASDTWKWAVFSRTIAGGWMLPGQSGPPNLAGAVSPVTNGWVDNAWDIQRRRGLVASTRTVF